MSGETIFQKIQNDTERNQILSDLAGRRGEIVGKSKNSSVTIQLRALTFTNSTLTCHPLNSSGPNLKDTELLLQFQVGPEKYITECNCKWSENEVILTLAHPLYRIQRRQDFRLRLPVGFSGRLEVAPPPGKRAKTHTLELLDISAGGVRVLERTNSEFTEKLKSGSELDASLFCPGIGRYPVQLEVVRIQTDSLNSSHRQIAFRFYHKSKQAKSDLLGLVMEIYREVFAKTG